MLLVSLKNKNLAKPCDFQYIHQLLFFFAFFFVVFFFFFFFFVERQNIT